MNKRAVPLDIVVFCLLIVGIFVAAVWVFGSDRPTIDYAQQKQAQRTDSLDESGCTIAFWRCAQPASAIKFLLEKIDRLKAKHRREITARENESHRETIRQGECCRHMNSCSMDHNKCKRYLTIHGKPSPTKGCKGFKGKQRRACLKSKRTLFFWNCSEESIDEGGGSDDPSWFVTIVRKASWWKHTTHVRCWFRDNGHGWPGQP